MYISALEIYDFDEQFVDAHGMIYNNLGMAFKYKYNLLSKKIVELSDKGKKEGTDTHYKILQ